jgi:hypothetical protein
MYRKVVKIGSFSNPPHSPFEDVIDHFEGVGNVAVSSEMFIMSFVITYCSMFVGTTLDFTHFHRPPFGLFNMVIKTKLCTNCKTFYDLSTI